MHLRLATTLIFLASLTASLGSQAANWQVVASDQGERVEIDKSRFARVGGGKTMAWSRLVLGRDMPIASSKETYSMVEALNRYDCDKHRFATVKRVYLREGRMVHQEAIEAPKEMEAEAKSIDDKLLSEACKARTVGEMQKAAEQANKTVAEVKPVEAPPKAMYADMRSGEQEKAPTMRSAADAHAPTPAPAAAAKPAEAAPAHAAPAAPAYVRRRPRPAAAPAAAEPEAPHTHPHWSYEGEGAPANWSKLQPEYATCASGKRQSPIDIKDTIKVDQEPIKFDYKISMFRITDNGHTVQIDVGAGSKISIMGRQYELQQLHFHRPAEERVNGRAYDMVVHLVHKDDENHLAVVAVLLEKGSEHPLIQTFWNNLPLEAGQDVVANVPVDLTTLLPESRAYFAYMGSLTTPPCSEEVLWLVLKQPVQISPEQVAIFSRLYRNNARPLQPANGRLIKETR